MRRLLLTCFFALSTCTTLLLGDEPTLLGRWPLGARPGAPNDAPLSMTVRDIKSSTGGPGKSSATTFNGRNSVAEIADAAELRLGTSEFTIALWVNAATQGHESPGDLLSQYDPATRTGFHLGLYTHGGVT